MDERNEIVKQTVDALLSLKEKTRIKYNSIKNDKKNCLISTAVGATGGLIATATIATVTVLTGGLAFIPALIATSTLTTAITAGGTAVTVGGIATVAGSQAVSHGASKKLKQLKHSTQESLRLTIKTFISKLQVLTNEKVEKGIITELENNLLNTAVISGEANDNTIEKICLTAAGAGGQVVSTVTELIELITKSKLASVSAYLSATKLFIPPICLLALACLAIYEYKNYDDEILMAEEVIENVISLIKCVKF